MSVVAVDIGSSRIKALLARWDGHVIEVRSVSTPVQAVAPGERAYPAEVVYAATESLVAGVAADHPDEPIDTVTFSCLGTAMVPVDQSERSLGAALSPADERPFADLGLDVGLGLSAPRLQHMTGSDPAVASFLLHFLWWQRNHPQVMERLHRFRSLRGFIVQRLCGADAEDRSWASRTMLLDLERPDAWSETILSAAGLPGDALPDIESSTVSWPVRPSAGARFGLQSDAQVVLGGMDNCCSLLGATDPTESRLAIIVGTYEHVAGSGDLALARLAAKAGGGVVHTYLVPDQYLSMTRVPLGHLLDQVAAASSHDLDELLEQVSEHPQGIEIGLDPDAVRATLDAGSPPGLVVQALLESSAAVLKRFADQWAGAGHQTSHLVTVGGGTGRARLNQLKANVLGRSISTLAFDEGAGFGALRLAAMATQGASVSQACVLFPNPVSMTWSPGSGYR